MVLWSIAMPENVAGELEPLSHLIPHGAKPGLLFLLAQLTIGFDAV
jgi:hypothetical protein